MWRRVSSVVLQLLVASSIASCAGPMAEGTNTYFGFSIDLRSAPPPPRLRFDAEPEREYVQGSDVYVVRSPNPDCDMFQYQGTWFVYYSGYWYQCDRYDGSFVAVDVRSVPRPVLEVPPGHWRHHPHNPHWGLLNPSNLVGGA
jgi:hypothetical protein